MHKVHMLEDEYGQVLRFSFAFQMQNCTMYKRCTLILIEAAFIVINPYLI